VSLLRLRAVEFHYVLPGVVQLPSRDMHGQQQLTFGGQASQLALDLVRVHFLYAGQNATSKRA